jgi:nucleoside-diphosphate-sugar epimerase
MKKVLITGVLGLVGSHVAEALAQSNFQVLGIDNLKTGRRINLPEVAKNIELVIGDISTPDLLANMAKEFSPDAIVHAAASYADPSDWSGDALTNILGSINVATAAQTTNSRVIYFQTALCYGLNPDQNPIKIDYPRQPAPSSYAISKTAGELYLESAKLDLVTFRLANIIGPRNLSGALPIFYKRITAGEKCTIADARRDFVDVRDVVPIVRKAIDGIGAGAYHLSSGSDISISQLYDEVLSKVGNDNQPAPDKVANPAENAFSILLDPTKTIKDFGPLKFRPLSETVSDAVDYYEKYGVSEERTHFHFRNN